jgi:Co/Zn/Cd efflux system component
MAGCQHENLTFEGASAGYRRILWVVIAINAAMFLVEMSAGLAAHSMALRADALDFLGDSATYLLTLMVIGRPQVWRSRAALFKGLSLAVLGLWILISTLYRLFVLQVPNEFVMGSIGILAFGANLVCVLLLLKYREGDANVRSVWICSRNDAIGNIAVVIAAFGVAGTGTAWPDLIVATILASLFLYSSSQILRQATKELRTV